MTSCAIRRPSSTALPGSGTRTMSASPIVLTRLAPKRGSSASTASANSATSIAACSSPCASVSAVKPAMSANRNVADDESRSGAGSCMALSRMEHAGGLSRVMQGLKPMPSTSSPLAVAERLTAAQNAHDLEGMVACFHDDYRSEQPMYPARAFQGVDQVRKNWSSLLESIRDFHAEIVRSAVDGDTVFIEIHWTGTKPDRTPFEERGVIVMGVRDERIAWGRLYAEEVEPAGADIDAVVRRLAGRDER